MKLCVPLTASGTVSGLPTVKQVAAGKALSKAAWRRRRVPWPGNWKN
jgi:hypothetical protein